MDGILAQYIAVALHGSAWLRRRGAAPALEVTNSTFQYVSRVGFEYLAGSPIDGVDDWLEQLTAAGVSEIAWLCPAAMRGLRTV